MTTCPVCGNTVPEGEYCGACGAHLATGSAHRAGAFAADPSQHVLQPNVVSTLFPHLPHRQSTPFRLGLLLTAILLAVLGTARLTGPAIAVAAVSVPLLYLLYLYEVEVYDREPWQVIGLTMGLGVLLGVPWAVITGPIITHALLHNTAAGPSFQRVLLEGVLLPIVAQLLMLIGAIILFFRGHHREPLDGFTFGAAGALGFTLATTLVNLGPELRLGLIGGAPAITNALMVLTRGLLIPFLTASTAGLIAGALWMRRQPRRRVPHSWTISLPAAIAVAVAVDVVLGVVGITILRLGLVVAIYLVVAAALLIWVRLALHSMLLTEAGSAEIGPPLPCPNCHWVVPRMAFCPHCGIATGATPKRGAGRLPAGDVPAAGAAAGSHRAATPEELERLGRRGSPRKAWAGLAGIVAASAVALGITAAVVTPSRRLACRAVCAPPPPPCLGFCKHASPAPPLRTDQSYTSSEYGYSVDYTGFSPSNQDSSSVEWDLSSDAGQYVIQEAATRPNGRSAQDILGDVIANNFQDYSHLYDVPGAEVGYTSGAGAVYDDETTPLFGTATDTRLVVLTAENKDVAIVVVGNGDASSQGSQPDPSGLPVSSFVDDLANGTRWPGQPPR